MCMFRTDMKTKQITKWRLGWKVCRRGYTGAVYGVPIPRSPRKILEASGLPTHRNEVGFYIFLQYRDAARYAVGGDTILQTEYKGKCVFGRSRKSKGVRTQFIRFSNVM